MGKALKPILTFAAIFVAVALFGPGGGGLVAGLTNTTASVLLSFGFSSVPVWVAAAVAGGVFGVGMTLLSEIAKPKIPQANGAANQRLNKSLDPEAFRKIVFGETAGGQDMRYWETSGVENKDYDEVIAVATHKVHSFGNFYLEEELINFDAGNTVTNSGYNGRLKRYTVTEGGPSVSPTAVGAGVAYPVTTARLTGCAYYVLKYNWHAPTWPQGFPSRYTQVVKGALVYDPRLDSLRGGEGDHRTDDQTTWKYNSGRLVGTGTASNDPILRSPTGLTINGATFTKVKVRFRYTSGTPIWEGRCYYTTAGHGETSSYYKSIPAPTLVQNKWVEATFDMSALTAGGTDWTTNTITQFRLDLFNSVNTNIEVDWIVVENAAGNSNTLTYQFESSVEGWTGGNLTLTQSGRDIGRNPALQILWYLLGWRITDPANSSKKTLVAGMGVDPNDIDFASFIVAANDCELAGYNSDCILSTGDAHETNLDILEAACGGKLLDTGGRYSLHVGVDDTATIAAQFDSNDIIGPVEWVPRLPMRDQFNVVQGQFIDPASLYVPKSFPDIKDATYITADGYERAVNAIFAAVQSNAQVQKLARILLNQSRFQGVFRAPFNYKALLVKNWDVIELTFPMYGWSEKLFRIVGYELSTSGAIALTLREIDPAIWVESSVISLPGGTGTGFNPRVKLTVSGFDVDPYTVVGSDGTPGSQIRDGLILTWTAPGDLHARSDAQYRRVGDTDWIDANPVGAGSILMIIDTTLSVTEYEVRARHVTAFGVVGDWTTPVVVVTGGDAGASSYQETRYRRSVSPPDAPSGDNPADWSTVPTAGSNVALWSTSAVKSLQGELIGVWSTPVLMTTPNWRGDYNPAETYWREDGVYLNGGSYKARVDSIQHVLKATGSGAVQLSSPGSLTVAGGTYTRVRVRARCTSASPPAWFGRLYYSTSGHGMSGSYYKDVPQPNLYLTDQWWVLEFDMAALTAGGTDWTSNTITQLRLDLGAATGNWEVDYIEFLDTAGTPFFGWYFGETTQSFTATNATLSWVGGEGPTGTPDSNAWWDVISAPGSPGSPGTPPAVFNATIDVTSSTTGVNLRLLADAAGYTGDSDCNITFELESGVSCVGLAGAPNGGFGIDTGVWPTGSYAINLDLVVKTGANVWGGGGKGGNGGNCLAPEAAENGQIGGTGGDAINCRAPIDITIQSGATVRGGGGGGGGGGGADGLSTTSILSRQQAGGGGGGGGQPNGPGGLKGEGDDFDGGAGTAGTSSAAGSRGLGNQVGNRDPGHGGNGGVWATAGVAGQNANGSFDEGTGGAFGAGGYAIRKNGNTVNVTNSGTLTGTVG